VVALRSRPLRPNRTSIIVADALTAFSLVSWCRLRPNTWIAELSAGAASIR
jgi:hypothetical protein